MRMKEGLNIAEYGPYKIVYRRYNIFEINEAGNSNPRLYVYMNDKEVNDKKATLCKIAAELGLEFKPNWDQYHLARHIIGYIIENNIK